jgi:NADH-quinone oxidoreductase subunit M
MSHYLSLLVFSPLAGALALLCVPRAHEHVVRGAAGAGALGAFLLAVPLWFWYDTTNPAFQFAERATWMPSIGASYFLGLDGFSLLLILLTTLMTLLAMVSSPFASIRRAKAFYCAVLVIETAVLGALTALDVLLFFLCWEVTLVSVCVLVGIGGTGRSARVPAKLLVQSFVASALLLIGILALYFQAHAATGVYSFDATGLQALALSGGTQSWAFLALFAGFAVVVPLFAFHACAGTVPGDAPAAAYVVASVLLSAVVLEIAAYGFIRYNLLLLPDAARSFAAPLTMLSVAGIAFGGMGALRQTEWRRMIAFWSTGQMALITLGALALNPIGLSGSMIQLLNHGLSTGALVLLSGVMASRYRERNDQNAGGLAGGKRIFTAMFLLLTLSSIGVPMLNGFVGEFLILQGAFTAHAGWAACAAGGVGLGALALVRGYQQTGSRSAVRIVPASAGHAVSGSGMRTALFDRADLGPRGLAVVVPIVALVFWIGLYPKPFLARLESSVQRVIARVSPEYPSTAAECDPTVTPAMRAADPSAQFLLAAPCGPDGQPLPPASSGTTP